MKGAAAATDDGCKGAVDAPAGGCWTALCFGFRRGSGTRWRGVGGGVRTRGRSGAATAARAPACGRRVGVTAVSGLGGAQHWQRSRGSGRAPTIGSRA